MLLRKIFLCGLLFLCQTDFVAGNPSESNTVEIGMSTTKKVIIGGAVCAGIATTVVFTGPAIAAAGGVAAVKTTAAAVATKAAIVATGAKVVAEVKAAEAAIVSGLTAAAPYVSPAAAWVGKTRCAIWCGKKTKEYFYPTTEQEVEQLKKEAREKPFEESLKEAFEKNVGCV